MRTRAELEVDDVLAIIREIWDAFLGGSDTLAPAAGPADYDDDTVEASVAVSGAWNGVVGVVLPQPAARAVTCTMLEATEVTHDDITDAVGELANMVGGNIKSLLPSPSQLALPRVTYGWRSQPPRHGRITCSADLTWATHPFSVWVYAGAPVF